MLVRARHFILCLALIQPRRTRKCPDMTEKLLTRMLSPNTNIQNIWALMHENLALFQVNKKGADQTVHPHSLISTFIVCCVESLIVTLDTCKISITYLVFVAEQTHLSRTRSETLLVMAILNIM